MSEIRELAASCEAKLHGFRRTADGVVVSFVVHPEQVPQALALDPLGSRYMLAFVAISDQETPIAPGHVKQSAAETDRSAKAKEKYASTSEREKALIRAAAYPKDRRFQEYMCAPDETRAAELLRGDLFIKSRAEILTNDKVYAGFLALENRYKQWAGLMPEVR